MFKKRFIYLGYATAWNLLRVLPKRMAYGLMRLIADRITAKNIAGVRRLRSNYHRVLPHLSEAEREELVREGMRSYLRYWCDTFRLPSWSKQEIISSVTVSHEEYLRDPLSAGRGCVVSLPHAGNWDHAGAYFSMTGAPIVTVAERLEPEKLFNKFVAYRESLGFEVLDASSRSLAILSQRLRANRLVALVADRDLSKNGVDVTFCGGPARMPAGPALLSIQTGAPLITAFVSYTKTGIHIDFDPEIPVPDSGTTAEKVSIMIQQTADRLEKRLKDHLVDWHMLQRIWIDGDFVEQD
jgi:KDO2-lipid IV(A) lauroyltransferase